MTETMGLFFLLANYLPWVANYGDLVLCDCKPSELLNVYQKSLDFNIKKVILASLVSTFLV